MTTIIARLRFPRMPRAIARPGSRAAVLAAIACVVMTGMAPADSAPALRLVVVATGLDRPVQAVAPTGDPRLFIVEQVGRIRVLKSGRLLAAPFLDLRDRIRAGGEQGLLSVAFHPRYRVNGLFYVNFTDRHGDTRVECYHVSADPDRAAPAPVREILLVHQPYANHNGGLVMFGPDGMLYVGMGDGGSGGDPHGNAQDPATLLGKLLRLGVDGRAPYVIPPDNPFVGRPGMRAEIWALGLRNPWRFCFDAASRLLIIGDVGQGEWEEIDAVPAGVGGWNFGWNRMEGRHLFREATRPTTPLTPPVDQYDHRHGCSIIGGYVYHGARIPALAGLYLYSDYCDGRLRAIRIEHSAVTERREWDLHASGAVSSFGMDAAGEIYLTTLDGRVSRIEAAR